MAVKYTTDGLSGELEIKITQRDRSQIPVAIFLTFWLMGWAGGEIFALYKLFSPGEPLMVKGFLLIWVTAWTVGGVFAFASLMKMIGGYELIHVGRGMMRISRSFVVLKFNKRYDLFKIRSLRVVAKQPNKLAFWNKGVFQFRYEEKEVRFGAGLSKSERDEFFLSFSNHRDLNESNFN